MRRFSEREREGLLRQSAELPPSSPSLLTLSDGLAGSVPRGFAHDRSRSLLGTGAETFRKARAALREWEEFHLGWVEIAGNPSLRQNELIAVEARTAFLWSMNLSRITEVVDAPGRFGFLHTTTAWHVEEGQERFLIEYSGGSVWYLIDAVSRPRHVLAQVFYSYARRKQHQFARDSHARMKQQAALRTAGSA